MNSNVSISKNTREYFLSSLVWSFLLILTILVYLFLENAITYEGIFEIEDICTKRGEEWHIDMINPSADNRFDPYNLLAMEVRNPPDTPLLKIIQNRR